MEESQKSLAMSKVQNLAEMSPNLPFTEFDLYALYRATFKRSGFGRIKRLLPLRDMAEDFGLTSGKHDAEARNEAVLHSERQGGADVPEDVHGTELPETDRADERERPLPDVLRRADRPVQTADELQAAG